MKWFNEHLNWTFGIVVIISIIILLSTAISSHSLGPSFLIGLGIFFLLNVSAGIWVLRKKGQSPWYVVLAIVFYLGFLVLIPLLKNNKANREEDKKISDADYYQSRQS